MTKPPSPHQSLDNLLKENGWTIEEAAQRLRKLDSAHFGTLNPSTVYRWLELRRESPDLLRTVEKAVRLLRRSVHEAPTLKVGMMRGGAGLLPARLVSEKVTDPNDPLHLDSFGLRVESHILDAANTVLTLLDRELHLGVASRHWMKAYDVDNMPFRRLCEIGRLPIEAAFRKDLEFTQNDIARYVFAVPAGTSYIHNLEAFAHGVTWQKEHLSAEIIQDPAALRKALSSIDGVIGDPPFVNKVYRSTDRFQPLPPLIFGINYIDVFVSKHLPRTISLQVIMNYVNALKHAIRFLNGWFRTEESNESPKVRLKRSEEATSYHGLFQALSDICGGSQPMLEIIGDFKSFSFSLGALETETILNLWASDRNLVAYQGLFDASREMKAVPLELMASLARYAVKAGLLEDSMTWLSELKKSRKGQLLLKQLQLHGEFLVLESEIKSLLAA